jgi:hypothetical protein
MTYRSQPNEAMVAQAAQALDSIVCHCGTGPDDVKRDERVASARRLAESLRAPKPTSDESMRIDAEIERVVTYISLIESASETGASHERVERMRREAHKAVAALIGLLSGHGQKQGKAAEPAKPAGFDYGPAPTGRSGVHLSGRTERGMAEMHAGSVCIDTGTTQRDGTADARDPFWVRPPEWQILLENGRINQTQRHSPPPLDEASGPCPHLRRRMTAAFSTLIAAALATIAFAE